MVLHVATYRRIQCFMVTCILVVFCSVVSQEKEKNVTLGLQSPQIVPLNEIHNILTCPFILRSTISTHRVSLNHHSPQETNIFTLLKIVFIVFMFYRFFWTTCLKLCKLWLLNLAATFYLIFRMWFVTVCSTGPLICLYLCGGDSCTVRQFNR